MRFRSHLPSEHSRFKWVWAGVLLLFIFLAAVRAYSGDPRLSSTWRGLVTGLLLLLFLAWMLVGMHERFALRGEVFPFGVISWCGVLAISLALVLLSRDFAIILWILFGSTPFYLGKRLGLAPMIGVMVLIGLIQADGLTLPRDHAQWASLAGWLLEATVWILLILSLAQLVRNRIENEQLIADLQASQEQLRQAAAQERELVLLRERERFARDLHDIIGHALVLASVKLEAAQRLALVDRDRSAGELAATQQLLRQTMTELRQAVSNLRAVPIDREDLAQAMTNQVNEFVHQTGLRADIECDPVAGLSLVQTDALQRVAQEALTNIVKHASATTVSVMLRRRGTDAVLDIADDGRGFRPDDPAAADHFGLRGMRERIELAGGKLTIESAPGAGTRIRATLPMGADGLSALPEPEVSRDVA